MKNLFLSNSSNIRFIEKIKDSLNKCNKFYFSVSFIKAAGLNLFDKNIEDALKRGAIGYIITSTYQNFTDIPSLEKFYLFQEKYPNFKCHIDYNCFEDSGYHTKGYLFEYDNSVEVIIGSSNITRYALLKNIEWNLSIESSSDLNTYRDSLKEYNQLWDKTHELSLDIINSYRLVLEYAIERWDMDYSEKAIGIKPNAMQKKALKEIKRYRDTGSQRALIIAATGSGKTYLAAMDAKNFGAKRLLFVVHRDTIITEAINSFKKIFGTSRTYLYYKGDTKEESADFIFSTNIMISTNLDLFDKKEFDYIIIDEVHHAVADTYKKIIEYFEPEFLLGLTATPERMDNQDVYEIFDKNVPFELRLREALNNDLIVPFKYYGIRNEYIDYNLKNSNDIQKLIRQYANEDNIDLIIESILKYKVPHEKLKCIAFCKNIEHANLMANKFNEKGFYCKALTGNNSTVERLKAYDEIQDEQNNLEIICTVDILNEGVDIPGINMVLFLRPTDSSTIFIQQLGRGLRKFNNKEYLVVLDFIGNNYSRSEQIALALGSLSKNNVIEKCYLMDLIRNDFRDLELPIEIHIDEFSKEEILSKIEKTNFNNKDFLIKDYNNYKKYLNTNTYPLHIDYLNAEYAPNLIRLIKSKLNGKKNKSYYSFLKKIGEETIPYFNDDEVALIDNISDLLPIVRREEFLIIKEIILGNEKIKDIKEKVLLLLSDLNIIDHAIYILKMKNIIIEKDNKLILNIKNNLSIDLRNYLTDLIEYGLSKYEIDFNDFSGKFKLYANYYKEQVMMVELENSLMSMKGTKFNLNNETIIFIGLKKDKDKQELLNYKDKFISPKIFQWESENYTTMTNSIGQKILKTKVFHLFVRKMDEEDGITLPFTYFGKCTRKEITESKNNDKDTLTLLVELEEEVPSYLRNDFKVPDYE